MKTSQAPPVRVMRWISRVNVVVYRLTGGKRITLPLMCTADGDDVVLVASMGGAPKTRPGTTT